MTGSLKKQKPLAIIAPKKGLSQRHCRNTSSVKSNLKLQSSLAKSTMIRIMITSSNDPNKKEWHSGLQHRFSYLCYLHKTRYADIDRRQGFLSLSICTTHQTPWTGPIKATPWQFVSSALTGWLESADFVRLSQQTEAGQGVTTSGDAELNILPIMRHFRDQKTDPVHSMDAGENPLIRIIAAIDHSPDMR